MNCRQQSRAWIHALPLLSREEAEAVARKPECVAGMVREGVDDRAPTLERWDESISYITTFGGWYFVPIKGRVYEAHFFYTKDSWGKLAVEHSRAVLHDISDRVDTLLGQIAKENRHALRFVRSLNGIVVDTLKGDFWLGDKKTDIEVIRYECKKIRRLGR